MQINILTKTHENKKMRNYIHCSLLSNDSFHRQIPSTNIYSELYGGVEQGIIFYFDIISLKKVLFKKDN